MNFNSVKQLTDTDLQAVNKLIHYNLSSDVALINQLSHHIIQSGGKRLRPLIVILTAKALGYQGKHHYQLAAIIEFIHTATLLHDDVVDASSMRRGRATANALWGNEASVLVGDFLYSRSFEMMVEIQNMQVMNVLSTTTNKIAEGEVLQLMNCNNPDTTEKQYMKVIKRKTAELFMAGAQLGGIIASAST
ncbi:MAG: octaprenyl diphosphate synthase, partial [Methylococcales bacterium]|nr:octaprenyl diphosphate synthase [Methylococcales bacterium]